MTVEGNIFWLVWRENSQQVTYKHATRASADTEAQRLAAMMPGELFYVVKSATAFARPIGEVTKAKLKPLEQNELTSYDARPLPLDMMDDEAIPF